MIKVYDKLFDLSFNIQNIINDTSINIINDPSTNIISDPSTNELLVNISTGYANNFLNERLLDPVGNDNAIGDYSSSSIDFSYNATQNDTYIKRLLIYIQAIGGTRTDRYGSLNEITNGIRLYLLPSGGSKEYISIPITTNGSFVRNAHDGSFLIVGGGDNAFVSRWEFSAGTSLKLNNGDIFGIELNDDFSVTDGGAAGRSLVFNCFTIQGCIL